MLGGIGAVASALVGLGGYLHYRYGSKVKSAGEVAVSIEEFPP